MIKIIAKGKFEIKTAIQFIENDSSLLTLQDTERKSLLKLINSISNIDCISIKQKSCGIGLSTIIKIAKTDGYSIKRNITDVSNW